MKRALPALLSLFLLPPFHARAASFPIILDRAVPLQQRKLDQHGKHGRLARRNLAALPAIKAADRAAGIKLRELFDAGFHRPSAIEGIAPTGFLKRPTKPLGRETLNQKIEKKLPPEPGFAPQWRPIAQGLWRGKNHASALRLLASRFQRAATPTGLSPDAPEALRLLAQAIYDNRGGEGAKDELNRELRLVAKLPPAQKAAFAAGLKSPLPVYVALSLSPAPHFAEARLYFSRMEKLLQADGLSITDYIHFIDPGKRLASSFLLRSHAYEALLPYLDRHPSEAAAVVPLLFSGSGQIESQASRLEGLGTQLAAQGRGAALRAFVGAALDLTRTAEPARARRVALFLKLNEPYLPADLLSPIDSAARVLPPHLDDDPTLIPATPYASWPADRWTFTLHFAKRDLLESWLNYFRARGYAFEPVNRGGITISKPGPVTVVLIGKMYQGDEEGFLHGAEARRFRKAVSIDLRDPRLQGVVLRTHAQFSSRDLFRRGVSPGKFWLDGGCRGAWDMPVLQGTCRDCSLVANVGTGVGAVNNRALYVIFEGFSRKKSWTEIRRDMNRALRQEASRFEGPWTPPYGKALVLLRQREKKARRGFRGSMPKM